MISLTRRWAAAVCWRPRRRLVDSETRCHQTPTRAGPTHGRPDRQQVRAIAARTPSPRRTARSTPSGSRGLGVADRRELPLQPQQHLPLAAALEHLRHERAALFQHLAGKIQSSVGEGHDAQMVRRGVTGGIGAMSDSTRSALPPSASTTSGPTSGSRKSPAAASRRAACRSATGLTPPPVRRHAAPRPGSSRPAPRPDPPRASPAGSA